MKFGPVPVSAAEGAVLAHSVAVGSGKLRKGKYLSAADLQALAEAGHLEVIVARLEPGDVAEDAAALRLAQALVPDPDAAGLRLGQASTGRVNLYATGAGIVEVLADRVHALNAVDPMITLATVPAWQRIANGGMVATAKIISYAVAESALDAACHAGQAALRLRRPQLRSARLIQTTIGSESPSGKGQKVTQDRLDRFGIELGPETWVPHSVDALAQALNSTAEELVLILTGSATSDSHDVAPNAVRAAGGTITQFGMPVDPGNLLFFGRLQGRVVVGLPGCARSPALNGADWVLERLICGVPLGQAEIAAMGVGGLLKDIPLRGRPREGG